MNPIVEAVYEALIERGLVWSEQHALATAQVTAHAACEAILRIAAEQAHDIADGRWLPHEPVAYVSGWDDGVEQFLSLLTGGEIPDAKAHALLHDPERYIADARRRAREDIQAKSCVRDCLADEIGGGEG